MKKIIFTLSLICLLSSCAAMKATSYYPEERLLPTEPEKVLILNTLPLREHRTIGQVTLASLTYSEKELRKKVSQMGGDAVIFDNFARDQPVTRPGRPEATVSPEGRVITHNQPRIYAVQNTKITAKIIKFQD